MTFRHDELDLPTLASEPAKTSASAGPVGGTERTPANTGRRKSVRIFEASRFKHALRGSLLTTWLVAAGVSGVAGLVLGAKLQVPHRVAGVPAGPTPQLPVPKPVEANAAAKPPDSEPVKVLSVAGARRWDSHVALGPSDFASNGPASVNTAMLSKQHSAKPAARVTSTGPARVGAVSVESHSRTGARAKPLPTISVLDAPIAPPDD